MMPIFSLYLLKNYLNVLILSVASFITILLVSRLEEIAEFAAMGAKPIYLFMFTLYQIPYILPIAIPISCLISALILFQHLSHTHELTALRSCGISLKKIISPVLLASFFLSIGTFYIASEIATYSHLATRKMVYELSSVNPLLLLQNAKIARLQDAYVQMEPLRNGESAKNLVIALNNASSNRLNLCLVKHIKMDQKKLLAENVSLISSSPAEGTFDHLMIENQKSMVASALEFAKLVRKSGWKMANDYLKFSLLRIRIHKLRDHIARNQNGMRNLNKCYSEIVRRLAIGCSATTFTLLGLAFGMEISRHRKKRGIIFTLLLSSICLIAFCIGKECDQLFWFASLCFIMPQCLTVLASFWSLNRINRGIE